MSDERLPIQCFNRLRALDSSMGKPDPTYNWVTQVKMIVAELGCQGLFSLRSDENKCPKKECMSTPIGAEGLLELATPKSFSVEEASWAKDHYENIVTAEFLKGVRPDIRRQLLFDPPSTFERAVNKAAKVGEAIELFCLRF
ncbi:unnamed protein product [Nezara viridula]|uniref:Uncharacterized protein n=1 Tax=Nezara viridula TaxID=85310 RepID=A0A9P0E367_NEZVI|nr:unnamed protein product [Nezara viridula]